MVSCVQVRRVLVVRSVFPPQEFAVSPIDVLFNPIAPSFNRTGKFIRSQMTMGDFAVQLAQETPADNQEAAQKLLEYMREMRTQIGRTAGTYDIKNEILNVCGLEELVHVCGPSQRVMRQHRELGLTLGAWIKG